MKKDTDKLHDRKKISKIFGDLSNDVGRFTTDISSKTKDVVVRTKDSVINSIDANGNGKVDIEDVIIMALKIPGIRIDRSDFL